MKSELSSGKNWSWRVSISCSPYKAKLQVYELVGKVFKLKMEKASKIRCAFFGNLASMFSEIDTAYLRLPLLIHCFMKSVSSVSHSLNRPARSFSNSLKA